ncbi:MAG: reverse transcriptase domain-containing protein, partial [Sweet potato little leaf phytoplasma]|nr:reverse transcriptase domain-containing protein [Sweet potato little leaf phytoplasma]
MKHLRTFGCAAYAHIRQDKLEPRAIKCIFLGYPGGIKAYRLWSLELGENKCIVSRDVTFNEDEMPWKNHNSNPKQTESESFEIELQPLYSNGAPNVTNDSVLEEPQSSVVQLEEHVSETENAPEPETETSDYQLTRDRTRRVIRRPAKYESSDFVGYAFNCYTESFSSEPSTYNEAIKSKNCEEWLSAMKQELQSLHSNNTWKLVEKPEGKKIIDCKWVFKLKPGLGINDQPRYKARLVAKGFSQVEGVDYT